ncbi:Gamma-aminobutyric acid receptor subunit gamma-4 [Bagarius yarrelli]|uniref:Gamma-aminobutyric acid receptor subunit gamma-4 n=1 Tax=Bagarius yarrelli TaxID=175774 RepID=A0A556V6J4_BAGYA|nr:Gamma-aminobutyric acid receptor subunit gamma-4 [Bagarius yarrelli]
MISLKLCRNAIFCRSAASGEDEEYDDVTVSQMLSPKKSETDATQILNNLLKEYDKKLRPDIGVQGRAIGVRKKAGLLDRGLGLLDRGRVTAKRAGLLQRGRRVTAKRAGLLQRGRGYSTEGRGYCLEGVHYWTGLPDRGRC